MTIEVKINEKKKIEMGIKDYQELVHYLMCECNEKDYLLFEKEFQKFLFQNKKLNKL